jgi:dynein heavy chain
MTQSMGFSPHKKAFEERLRKWDSNLQLCGSVLEAWMSLQRGWLYLEPIFAAPDLLRHLPVEAKRFATVDRIWRKVVPSNTYWSKLFFFLSMVSSCLFLSIVLVI